MSRKPSPPTPARLLAEKIAKSLFINGAGEEANRLVLELPDGRNGGGYGFEGAVIQITHVLITQRISL